MATIGTPGSSHSLRLSPSKARNRGSGELVEFCAESLHGSKQYVRQEAAQDPCGHDLLPPPPALTLPANQPPAFRAALPPGHSPPLGGLSTSPPCPSPDTGDQTAAVISDGGNSSRGASQPGSAHSHTSSGSISRAFPLSMGAAADLYSPPVSGVVSLGGHPPDSPAAPLAGGRYCSTLQGPFAEAPGPFAAAAAVAGAADAPREVVPRLVAEFSEERKAAMLSMLELPGSARSVVVDDSNFVTASSLCLTPIRTRTQNTEQTDPASPPISYADSLVPQSTVSAVLDACGLKTVHTHRPTIHMTASCGSMAAPGAYNPYDCTTMAAVGYGGGRSYNFNYGCPTTGPATTSTLANHHQPKKQLFGGGGAPATTHAQPAQERAPPAAARPTTAAGAGEQGWWQHPATAQQAAPAWQGQAQQEDEGADHVVRVPGGVRRRPPAPPQPQQDEDEEAEFIVKVPGGRLQPQQAQRRDDDDVEHIIMVPGMRRKAPAAACTPASVTPPATSPGGAWVLTAGSPAVAATVHKGCREVGATVRDTAVGRDEPELGGAAAVEVAARGAAVEEKKGSIRRANSASQLLKQVLKAVIVAGAALAAAAPSVRG